MILKPAFSWPVLVLSLLLPFAAGAQDVSEHDAKQTVLRYLEAQRQGNTHTMRSFIAGDLLEDKGPLLSNPTYPAYLGKTLANVEFSVGRTERLGRDSFLVRASMTYSLGDTTTKHYVLRKRGGDGTKTSGFLIHEERDPDF
ncbi:hypothetical protein [Roseovarius sp.]|uniref:hypothetical protein n=1 Tax=Roseovarius sp. TaxID=1486281 RepID=UPI0035634029